MRRELTLPYICETPKVLCANFWQQEDCQVTQNLIGDVVFPESPHGAGLQKAVYEGQQQSGMTLRLVRQLAGHVSPGLFLLAAAAVAPAQAPLSHRPVLLRFDLLLLLCY